jgi:2-polyprenyl-3-methyl-5-hydroxy-6-metoxy-1,4-benzoquinol methylase
MADQQRNDTNTGDTTTSGQAVAPDGSPVGLYAAMVPDQHSASLIHDAIPAGCTILELGAGAGRVTRALTALGHPVVAVDESAEMLQHIAGHIAGAETVLSRIEDLRLDRRFPAVLLMSFLIGYGNRKALLAACRRHVADDGAVIIQRETPQWFDSVQPRTWERDGIHYDLAEVTRPTPNTLRATIHYTKGSHTWTHTFTSIRLSDEELPDVLGDCDLVLDRFLDDDRGWLLARPA